MPQSPVAKSSWISGEAILPVGLLGILVIMLIPLPGFMLDLLLAGNLSLTILLMLITMGAKRALDLSVFPSLLLLLTLYRLSLNVATTRSILLKGSAGKLVEAFGDFVVGGDLIVGLIIFLILVIIQFVVITKGAGRISEVAARFTLDALPGKQMAIDAELNAGAIDETTARERREQLAQETEFYGAMDGASKFVRGDAIAGMIITALNLVGGIILGTTHGMSIVESGTRYSVLTIGDGLISQIPALIIAVTAGILVTKSNSPETLSEELETQLLQNSRPLSVGAGILSLLAFMPGLPKAPFLCMAGGLLILLVKRQRKQSAEATPSPPPTEEEHNQTENQVTDFLLRDRATIEVGARLVALMNPSRGKTLAERITSLRKDFSKERGLLVPPIRVRTQLKMAPNAYRILIAGRSVAQGELRTDKVLAILPENPAINIPGEETAEPAFQLPAKWIDSGLSQQAERHRFTVVDPTSVLLTHLGEILKQYGHELLTRETVKELLDQVREFAPTIVDELRSESVRMAILHQVLRQLVEDGIPLSDLAFIFEAIANGSVQHKTTDDLTDAVRVELGQLICDRYCTSEGNLRVLALEPRLEAKLRELTKEHQLAVGPESLNAIMNFAQEHWQQSQLSDQPLALLVDQSLRRTFKKLLRRSTPQLGIVAFQEVPSELGIEPVAILNWEQVFSEQQQLKHAVTTSEPPHEAAA